MDKKIDQLNIAINILTVANSKAVELENFTQAKEIRDTIIMLKNFKTFLIKE